MKSIRCPNCTTTNWAQAQACKFCGFVLVETQQYAQPAGNAYAGDGYVEVGRRSGPRQSYTPMASAGALKTGLALASMIVGIICIPTSFVLIGVILAPVGLILGIVALVQASKNPYIYGGKGFAAIGVALSSLALFLIAPIIAAVAIPNLLASKRAADEGSAISSLRKLHAAESTYQATYGNGSFGDLSTLNRASLIDPNLAAGVKNSYRYEVSVSNAGRSFEICATPTSKSAGGRSFLIAEDGVIRAANRNGSKAVRQDPPLGN